MFSSVNVSAAIADNIVMIFRKVASMCLAVCFFVVASSLVSCGRKEPPPPKAPEKKVVVAPPLKAPEPPKPPEPPSPDVKEVKETPKPKEVEKPIPPELERKAVRKKSGIPKPKKSALPLGVPVRVPAPPKIVTIDGLNWELKKHGLNAWASELGRGIAVNGYVRNEGEREAALSLARRFNPNITDMINIVAVYDNRIP
jgi:hypothetical protein